MRGIDPDDEGNWVGSCKKCNGRRGAIEVNNITKKRATARYAAAEGSAHFFERETQVTPTPNVAYLPEEKPNRQEESDSGLHGVIADQSAQTGPRLSTPMVGQSTYGGQVAELAKDLLGITLMPWQCHALNGQLEHDDAGDLIRRRSLVSVARQNGKTVTLKALIAWALIKEPERRGEPILVISTAHQLHLATEIFDQLAPVLEKEFGAKLKWSYGRNEAVMPDGTKWSVQAATAKAFHGFSPTYVVADEIWNISQDVLMNGAIPSQRAMRSPLLSCWSTAGTESSQAMLQLREEAVRSIDQGKTGKLYFAEWSVPPGVDPMSRPDLWPMANPAMGYTLDPAVLLDESEQIDKAAFLRASLNLWVSTERGWLEPGIWAGLETDSIPAGGVLAVDSSIDDSLYFGVRCQRTTDEKIVATVEFVCDSLADCWRQTISASEGCDHVCLTPGLFDLAPQQLERKRVQVGYAELQTHTATIRQLITEGQIAHTGETMLAEHVDRAVGVKTQRGFVLSSQKSPGPITLARCLIWAAALVAKPKSTAKPAIAFGR